MKHPGNSGNKLKPVDPGSLHLFRQSMEHEALLETARQLSETLNLRTVCETAFRRLAEMVRHDETLLLELSPEGNALTAIARHLTGVGSVEEAGWRTSHPLLVDSLTRAESVDLVNTGADDSPTGRDLSEAGLTSLLAMPVHADGAASALLLLGRRQPDLFTPDERDTTRKIATLLGYALQNARRHDQLQKAYARVHELTRRHNQRERQDRLAHVAAGVVQELNSALTPVIEFSGQLLFEISQGDHRHLDRYLQHIRTSSESAAATVRRFTALLQPSSEGVFPTDLNATVRNAIEITRPRWESLALAAGTEVKLRLNFGVIPVLQVSCGQLLDGLTDLVLALASELSTRAGVLSFRTRTTSESALIELGCSPLGTLAAPGSRLLPSAPRDEIEAIDSARIAIARCGGTLDSEETENGGRRFTITLPLAEDLSDRTTEPASLPKPAEPVRGLRLLVAEDEPLVREALCAALTQMGHAVLSTTDGEEAAKRLKPGYFDALLTDRSMPRLNGDGLAAIANEADPGLPVILLSGFGDMMNAAGELPPGVTRVLGKPVTSNSLRDALAGICRRPDPA